MNCPRCGCELDDMSPTCPGCLAEPPLAPAHGSPICEWEEEGCRCTRPAIYRTRWYWNVCRDHGGLLMVNRGIEYLVDLENRPHEGLGAADAQLQGCDRDAASRQISTSENAELSEPGGPVASATGNRVAPPGFAPVTGSAAGRK